jgi:hypothetical protein
MVAKILGLSHGDGGIYFISPSRGDDARRWKVGMSHNSLLKRINSYGICFTQVHIACIVKVKRQVSKERPSHARVIEKFVHQVLQGMGYHQKYAALEDRDGGHVNYVTRSRGEFYGDFDRTKINEIIRAIWPWLEQLGATIAYDPQAVINFDALEGTITSIQAAAKPEIVAAIIPHQRPIAARVLKSSDQFAAIQKAITVTPETTVRRSGRKRKASRRLRESLLK